MAIENEKLALKINFLKYIHPLKHIIKTLNQKECWIEQMKCLVKDFKTLLYLPFNEFWSTIVFNKQATVGLRTFLEEAAPPHLMDQLPQDDDILNIYIQIDHFAYLLLKRLITSTENEDTNISHYMWHLLYGHNIIDIGMLFDICTIYNQPYKKELEIMFKTLFSMQKMYNNDLKNFIEYTNKIFSQFQGKIELDLGYDNYTHEDQYKEANLSVIEDIVNFLLDTSCSISNFLEIYPEASIIFYEKKLHLQIASFYHSTKPLIYEKIISFNKLELFQEKLHASRLLLVKSVRQCFTHLTNQISNKKKSNHIIDEYFEAINELLAYNEFVIDYNIVYNLTKDIKKFKNTNKEIDLTRYDYLLKSLAVINIPNSEHEAKEFLEEQFELKNASKNLENTKLLSLINEVKDLLPHLGNGFIQKCLEFYDMDSEKVINMILEDCLPPELTQYDKNLSTISDYDINNFEDNATGYDASDKRSKKLKKLKAVLDDKSFRNEMRPFYEKYNFTEVTCAELESYYDDDYDDTYNEVEYVIPEPADENEKIRPDVVPRVLIEKKNITEYIEEEISNDEPQQVVNFQPFCENPEDIRERQARRYAAKQSNRSNRNKPKVSISSITSSGSNTELERQRKNENKAFHGNHNRRNAARNKQQKGMF